MKQPTRTLALSTIVFTGLISGATLAYADEDDGVPTRHTEAPPSSPPNTEADSPINNQATSTGFVDGSHFNM
jgi:hypothetical protein